MKVTVTNLTTLPVPLPGYINVAASSSLELTNQPPEYVAALKSHVDDGLISVVLEEEVGDTNLMALGLRVVMNTTANPAAGVNTCAVGFSVQTIQGFKVKGVYNLQHGVYNDSEGLVAAANAVLKTDAVNGKGSILAGEASNLTKVKTDANGEFACTLEDLVNETVTLISAALPKSAALDCRDVDQVVFS